ncbi:hypothetical protein B0H16DRAFT_348201 [Mycena metata]|uniref:Uncharacterized protein n=1 Tax=Mycena metata TaxID=1033252 RepID=A0AAD7HK70_9AGAR|nr:hypothetical protein B0H16DRAFT_348201 [Mycena metata]
MHARMLRVDAQDRALRDEASAVEGISTRTSTSACTSSRLTVSTTSAAAARSSPTRIKSSARTPLTPLLLVFVIFVVAQRRPRNDRQRRAHALLPREPLALHLHAVGEERRGASARGGHSSGRRCRGVCVRSVGVGGGGSGVGFGLGGGTGSRRLVLLITADHHHFRLCPPPLRFAAPGLQERRVGIGGSSWRNIAQTLRNRAREVRVVGVVRVHVVIHFFSSLGRFRLA